MDLLLVQTEVVFLRMQKIFGNKLIEQIFAAMRCILNERSKTLYAVLFLICFILMTHGYKYRSGTPQTVAILIPEKGYDIVLFDITTLYWFCRTLTQISKGVPDPWNRSYNNTNKIVTMLFKKLLKEIEITKAEFDLMRSKNTKPSTIHGLKKIRKEFLSIPKFWPIIDTTRISQCLVGKYLASLLYPVTTNEFSLKDSFDTANRIKAIPSYFFHIFIKNGYQYVSFDTESLFTNNPIKQTAEIILRRLY